MNIGILIIATNKYITFLAPLAKSIQKYFLPHDNITIYCFSDTKTYIDNIIYLPVMHEQWPLMTLKRYHIFTKYESTINVQDYLYYLDVDMLINDYIENKIIGDMVGVCHPYQNEKVPNCTYERNHLSTAYIKWGEGKNYFAGGFQGGKTKNYIEMCKKIVYNIDKDMKNGIIAIHNDESHLNRYYLDNQPAIILLSDYCKPEGKGYGKIIALNKNHKEMRG